MADWFKFFENGLDEPRLQYAIGTLSEVTPVWVGILSECCRHKSDSIGWDDDEAYLFGFSRRLNVSVAKVNEAINLLVRIHYIELADGRLKVLKWNDFQSEYMKRKFRANPTTVRTVSEHRPNNVRQEERRGEEIEEKEKTRSCIASSIDKQCLEHVYSLYPRQVGKKAALAKIEKAVRQYGLEKIQIATKSYAEAWKNAGPDEIQFCPHPSTWFYQERFNDEPSTWKRPNGTHQRTTQENSRNAGTIPPAIDYGEAARRKQIRQQQASEVRERQGEVGEQMAANDDQPPEACASVDGAL